MRSSQFIFFCLLFTFFYLRSMDLLHSPPRLFTSEGRPARKYLGTSFSNYPKSEYHEVCYFFVYFLYIFIYFWIFQVLLTMDSTTLNMHFWDSFICGHEYAKMQVHEDEFNRPSPKDMSSNTPEHEASINSLGELIYHIDYHGVTTHPNPTPKHP